MSTAASLLDQVVTGLRELLCDDTLTGLSGDERLTALRIAGEASRLVDAVIVETTTGIDPAFAHDAGCRNVNELLQRMLLTDSRTAAVLDRTADRVRREIGLSSGERLPAAWPALREALLDGALTPSGLLAATTPIEKARERIAAEDRAWADEALAWCARGYRTDAESHGSGHTSDEPSGPALTAEDLRHLSLSLATALDPDGAEPSDREASRARHVTIGKLKGGTHALSGTVLPEVAAQLQLIFDAYNNPKVGGAPLPGVMFADSDESPQDPFDSDDGAVIDGRTPGQKRHDAFAAALGIAARHQDMPALGGAAPTLVVHADIHDIAAGTGWATLPGSMAPVPIDTALHTGCTGTIQRVLFDEGRIVGITTTDRVFSSLQRRAIVLRDKECLIPGCHVPAEWCEIHHVVEHARGGPTDTGNGVPLCWWHHRTIDTAGWEIRMRDGVPQIRGPAWWDPSGRWRTPRPVLPRREPARA